MSTYRKFLSLLLFCVLALPVCAACAEAARSYNLPPTQEEVEQLLAAYKLPCYVAEASSYAAGRMLYDLRNDDDMTCGLNSGEEDGKRFVTMTLLLPREYGAEQDKAFRERELPRWLDMAAALYGSGREAKSVYQDFSAFAKDKDSTVDRRVTWTRRAGENNYRLDMQVFTDNSRYRIYTLYIMNTAACRRQTLSTVLTSMLLAADGELLAITERYATRIGPEGVEEPEVDLIGNYLNKTYALYFTERAYQKFTGDAWPWIWAGAGKPLRLLDLELEQSADASDTERKNFSATVLCGAQQATIYGYVHFSDDNLIFSFGMKDDSELRALLDE